MRKLELLSHPISEAICSTNRGLGDVTKHSDDPVQRTQSPSQAAIECLVSIPPEKFYNLLASVNELGMIGPSAIRCKYLRDLLKIARVPAGFSNE